MTTINYTYGNYDKQQVIYNRLQERKNTVRMENVANMIKSSLQHFVCLNSKQQTKLKGAIQNLTHIQQSQHTQTLIFFMHFIKFNNVQKNDIRTTQEVRSKKHNHVKIFPLNISQLRKRKDQWLPQKWKMEDTKRNRIQMGEIQKRSQRTQQQFLLLLCLLCICLQQYIQYLWKIQIRWNTYVTDTLTYFQKMKLEHAHIVQCKSVNYVCIQNTQICRSSICNIF
eukprot:TRINITY_DN3253_c0_g2_i4.p1 TRINITY_DN3253_c0_g2~~TRINITY_DN3253_c0_g2_i4.p1  ORF type:complete len:225 (+),score=-8.57 TRINITY_DN3253_c0_g2_i4:220-894(+)